MRTDWSDPDDRALARDIFGVDEFNLVCRMIRKWVQDRGFTVARVIDIELSVGAAVTIGLPDDRRLFVKVSRATVNADALDAQLEVQRTLRKRGFPAPELLTQPAALGAGWAVAMTYDRSGRPTDATRPNVRRLMAEGLARLIRQADDLRGLAHLPRQAAPQAGAIWPTPHSALFDFEATRAGAEWIDTIAADALAVLRGGGTPLVVGHNDWSAKNMRMHDDAIAVVYDWDSVVIATEPAILGTAAAHFPLTWEIDVPQTPAINEVAAFVRDYEKARGIAFTSLEVAEIEAGATYARAYKARCEHAIDELGTDWLGSSRESLADNGRFHF